MDVIRGIVRGGRIDLTVPPHWPEGTSVEVYPSELGPIKVGIDESEWRDDPAAIADWDTWIKTVEPLEHTEEELREIEEFDRKMSEYNIAAVRKQMETGSFE